MAMVVKQVVCLAILISLFTCTNTFIDTGNETWLEHHETPHAYATNMWWRFANYTAKAEGKKGPCYVCTKMPHSASGPRVIVEAPPPEYWECISFISIAGLVPALKTSGQWVCGPNETVWFIPQLFVRVTTVSSIPDSLFCVERSEGEHKLGEIPVSKCARTYQYCQMKSITCCHYCLLTGGEIDLEQCANNKPLPISTVVGYGWSNVTVREKCEYFCTYGGDPKCHRYVPNRRGTRALRDWVWLCGHSVYTSLPEDWSGRCALVSMEEHSLIVRPPKQESEVSRKSKRSLADRNKVLTVARDNPVPREHRLWTGTEKFFEAIFPGVGIVHLQIETEFIRYELLKFINATENTLGAVKEELRGLRLTALQNRLVLDQLTASKGGVCVIVGISCCTYIPDNDADGHLIDEGLMNMSRIAQEMQARELGSGQSDFLDWLTGWQKMLVNALIPIGVILLILAFIVCCIIPFIRLLINRAMNNLVSSQCAFMSRPVKGYMA